MVLIAAHFCPHTFPLPPVRRARCIIIASRGWAGLFLVMAAHRAHRSTAITPVCRWSVLRQCLGHEDEGPGSRKIL